VDGVCRDLEPVAAAGHPVDRLVSVIEARRGETGETGDAEGAEAGAAGGRGGDPALAAGRPGVFVASFLVLAVLLVVRNRALFAVRVDEQGDAAANSILTIQAKHFALLVGNYSRLGFAHPGPAFLYVQAFGEWLFHDVLHAVPSPWNGQALAVLVLNAALVAGALTVVAGWFRSRTAVLVAAAVGCAYLTVFGQTVGTVWMPFMYFAPYLLLLVSAASVAAGRVRDVWALGIAAGFLVHGHAEFLLFVPVLTGVAALALVRRHRGDLRGLLRRHRRAWLALAAVLAVFALPIMLNLALHWPGEFGRYLRYGGGAGGHSFAAAAGYALRFWPGGTAPVRLAVAVVLLVGVPLLAWRSTAPQRRFLLAGAGLAALATVLTVGYAMRGIDDLSQDYVGQFTRAVPLLLGVLLALAAVRRTGTAARAVTGAVLAVALVGLAVTPAVVTRRDEVADLSPAFTVLAQRAGGRPVVVDLDRDLWPELTALVVGGERRGVRVCARDPAWRFLVTARFVCSGQEVAAGAAVSLARPGTAPGATVLARVGRADLTG